METNYKPKPKVKGLKKSNMHSPALIFFIKCFFTQITADRDCAKLHKLGWLKKTDSFK